MSGSYLRSLAGPLTSVPSPSAQSRLDLRRQVAAANRLVGTGVTIWPEGTEQQWPQEIRRARQLREQAVQTILDDTALRLPHLQPYTERVIYNPESFDGNTMTWRGATAKEPVSGTYFSLINDPAFKDPMTLNRTVRHEIWHQLQHDHPQVYGASQSLREFDAHLRDLEHRQAFGLSPAETHFSLKTAAEKLREAQREPHWQQLQPMQRDTFQQRWGTVRRAAGSELRGAGFGQPAGHTTLNSPTPYSLGWIFEQGLRGGG